MAAVVEQGVSVVGVEVDGAQSGAKPGVQLPWARWSEVVVYQEHDDAGFAEEELGRSMLSDRRASSLVSLTSDYKLHICFRLGPSPPVRRWWFKSRLSFFLLSRV